MSKSKNHQKPNSVTILPPKKVTKRTFQKIVLIVITVIVLLTFVTPTIFSLMR